MPVLLILGANTPPLNLAEMYMEYHLFQKWHSISGNRPRKRVPLDEKTSGIECYFLAFPRVAINNVVDRDHKEEKEWCYRKEIYHLAPLFLLLIG